MRRGEKGRGGERRGEEGRGEERREDGNKIITSNFMHFLCHAGHLKVGTHFNYHNIFFPFNPPSALYSNPKHAHQGHPMQWLLPFRVK